jgi:ATP-dependent RNA helicase DDX10/DBP4
MPELIKPGPSRQNGLSKPKKKQNRPQQMKYSKVKRQVEKQKVEEVDKLALEYVSEHLLEKLANTDGNRYRSHQVI